MIGQRVAARAPGAAMGLALLAVAGSAAGDGGTSSARVSATAFSPVPAGWGQAVVTVQAGDGPWQGSLALTGRAAKVRVALSIPARGQRVFGFPFWVEPGERMPSMWLDRAGAGSVGSSKDSGHVLMVDGAQPLPVTWRAYESLDLVILPAEAAERLAAAEADALDTWAHWGGAVAVVRPGETTGTRPIGRGAAIVASSVADARAAFDRLQGAPERGEDPALSALRRWERSRAAAALPIEWTTRPGGGLAVVVVAYAVLLAAAGVLGPRVGPVRRTGLHLVLLLVGAATLAVWGVAFAAGGQVLTIRETGVVAARPDGEVTELGSAVRMRASRHATARWTSRAGAAIFYELVPWRRVGDPQRSVRWDIEGGFWERAWSIGETSVIRGTGVWPDLGVRVTAMSGGAAWRVENRGTHTLRGVMAVAADGSAGAVGDLGPSDVARVEAHPSRRAETMADPFWAGLFADGGGAPRRVLLARLDPPIASLRFGAGVIHASGETYMIVSLPPAGGSAP